MSDLASQLLGFARDERLFPETGLALLAVSGGPDSVALLDLMTCVASPMGLTLALAHVDHGISVDSGDVAEQVMSLAVRYRVVGHLTSLGLGPDASETRARRGRYSALRTVQRRIGARYLLTAHQADDQVETILYRALRGSGPSGLAGIPVRGVGGLVRPLLPFARDDLRAWLRHRFPEPGSAPATHTDPANFDIRHDRSWIRHHVLPVLHERMGAALELNLLRLARGAERDRRAWLAVLRALPGLDFRATPGVAEVARARLKDYDKALSEALLRAVAGEVGLPLGPRRAARLASFAVAAASGRRLELGNGWVAETAFDRLRLRRASTGVVQVTPPVAWGDSETGSVTWGGWEIGWRPEPAGEVTRAGMNTWVLGGPGAVRGMKPGDRIRPLGGVGQRRVCRVLMEGRVPRAERRGYPLLARGSEVLWIPGICRSAEGVPRLGDAAIRIEARPARRP